MQFWSLDNVLQFPPTHINKQHAATIQLLKGVLDALETPADQLGAAGLLHS